MKPFRLHSIVLAFGAALAAPAHAQSLAALYESARDYDAVVRSARSQYESVVARAEQSRAGTLPSVNLSVGASRSAADANIKLPPAYGGLAATVSASQPLYRPANWLTLEQARKSVVSAQAQLVAAEQDLEIRLSQAYFDVLAAQDALAFVMAQKAAVAEQLASAKRNFEVGTSTITDTREAQARYDLVGAQQIAAENDLHVKKIALDVLVGRTDVAPVPLTIPAQLPVLTPADVEAWVAEAMQRHPALRQSELALEVAQLETRKAEAAGKPVVDLTASVQHARNDGTASSFANSHLTTATVGVALNWPIFAGYSIQNRVKETLALEDKARSDLEAARRTVAQNTRTAFFGVLSGQGQVRALEAAEASSQSSLDANKLGYQVGVRINIDVLNAQSQLFQTKRDLARARYDVLLGGLKLRQANGTLQPDDLQRVNALLQR